MTMKKNKPMRAASVLLVLVLISTSFFCGVLAKYVITDNGTDTARVAKFGVVTAVEGNLFGTSYSLGTASPANVIQAWSANAESVSAVPNGDSKASGNVVAPGTKNEKGMTVSVAGKPEVSTRIILDAPEGDGNKDYTNTDIYLRSGDYYIMQKCYANVAPSSDAKGYPVVTITTDNMAKYYSLASNVYSALESVPSNGDVVYKAVQLTGAGGVGAMSSHTSGTTINWSSDNAYYPIKWSVGGTQATTVPAASTTAATTNDVAGVMMALGAGVNMTKQTSGDLNGKYTATANPNNDLSSSIGSKKITWEWDFSTADGDVWKDVATGGNWENTSIEDACDTVLGEMIADAVNGTGAFASDSADEYDVAVMDGSTLKQIVYANPDASSGSTNKVIVAYKGGGTAPTSWNDSNALACLTVTFGARITVEQID